MPVLSTAKLIALAVAAAAILSFMLLAFHWKSAMEDRGQQLVLACDATRKAANRPKLDCKQTPQQIQFLGDALDAVKAKTAAAQAEDAAHAREVESHQNIAGQESSHDYQAAVADARARAERVRHVSTPGANQGSGGKPSVSGSAAVAGGPGTATAQGRLPPADALTATEQALQLQAILDWGKKVGIVKP
ncbi:MAG: hypothetical protein JWR80_9506 [Bradyrhizobium sp.]|nr:hypothetical protein [Bradyrhizobium sp.]